MTRVRKSGQTPALGFIGVDGKAVVIAAAGMHDVISATTDGAAGPSIHNIESQRTVNANGWV